MDLPTKDLVKLVCFGIRGATLRKIFAFSSSELYHQTMFYHFLRARNIEQHPFLVSGGSANFTLLYAIARIVYDFDIKDVLELGAGQSTVLLTLLHENVREMNCCSFETDVNWIGVLPGKAQEVIQHNGLVEREIRGRRAQGYANIPNHRFDLIVVDGPQGTRRHSRWSSLELLENCRKEEFIVIFDDAGRVGERDTIKEFLKMLGNREVETKVLSGVNQQYLVFTKAYYRLMLY